MKSIRTFLRNLVFLSLFFAVLGLCLTPSIVQAEIKELKIAIGVDADTLNPQEQTTTLFQNMCDLMYDNFFFQDPQGKLHPRLATEYKVSPDGLTFTCVRELNFLMERTSTPTQLN